MKLTRAIIQSMTAEERRKPSIIDPKRKRRIAAGSGTDVTSVNNVLKNFDQMQKLMKEFGIGGGKLHGKKQRMSRANMLKMMGAMQQQPTTVQRKKK
jgi:signal recognition particle subunit SRP54